MAPPNGRQSVMLASAPLVGESHTQQVVNALRASAFSGSSSARTTGPLPAIRLSNSADG
jgi:hypothetical protein